MIKVLSAASRFANDLRLQEMKAFFEAKPEAGAGESSRKISLESAENNVKFIRTYSEDIRTWLSANVQP